MITRSRYKEFASPGWRIFEFLEMCEAADIHPVVTLNNKETPEDMADFVEYCYGSAETTTWGAVRASDRGRPEPYKEFWVEIGNEQGLSRSLVDDVVAVSGAMQAKAKALKLPFNLSLVVGGNGWRPAAFAPMMQALAPGTLTGTDVSDCARRRFHLVRGPF
jgi:alpha-L-arabinofuranosidase